MQRRLSIGIVVTVVAAAVLAGPMGLALAQEEPTPTPTTAGNETESPSTPIDQHDDPRNVSEQGDLGALSDWLGGHLSGRLEDGAIQLSQGQYESVEGLLGDEFESRLSQFVDVAGETNAESDDSTANRVELVADEQRNFTEDVQAYRETLREYRDARDRGDTAAARSDARELGELADDVQRNGSDLQSGYQSIANATGRNLTEGTAAIEGIVSNVSTTQAQVRAVTFVETSLSLSTNRSSVAFDRPVAVEGSVVAENGTALANRSITVQVGDRNLSARTDADGTFAVVYRPVTISASAESVPVTYRPRSKSVYLPASDDLSVSVAAVTPRIEVDDVADSVAFGERLSVDATIAVDGRPVPDAPVAVAVDGRTLSRSRTGASGDARLGPRLPASVDDGNRSVTIRGGREEQAVSIGSASSDVVVEETGTNITVAAETSDGQLLVSGRLSTDDGQTVPAQTVTISAASTTETATTETVTTETVTTNASGWYAVTIDGSSVGDAGERITVSAAFDGTGTNLWGASATTTASVSAAGGGGDDAPSASSGVPWLLVAVGLGALVVLAGLIVAYLRWDRSPSDEDTSRPVSESRDGTTPTPGDAAVWFDAARDALASGDGRGAVARAYTATYAHLQERLGFGGDRTPRELLAVAEDAAVQDAAPEDAPVADDGDEDKAELEDEVDVDALATVVHAYERMAFAGGRSLAADDVLEQASAVIGREQSAPSSDDD